ncbi:MAG: extracellular solute-binding protein, partial [Clostridiales bacterium]|nr:extracellular solute-binding protein [Clostridiales bacterium]
VIRQDWLEDLGLASPVTYDDYYNVLKAFKEKKGATQPLVLQATGVPWKSFLTDGFGVAGFMATVPFVDAPFYIDNGTVKFGVIENGFKEYLTMMNKWYNEGLISKDFLANMMPFPDDNIITTGKAGIWYNDTTAIHTTIQKANDPKYKLAGIQDAVKKAGDKLGLQNSGYPIAGGSWSITDKCKNVDVAVAWFDNLYSKEVQELSTWGLENEGYTVADGKKVISDNILKNAAGLSLMDAKYLYTNQITPYVQQTEWTKATVTADESAAAALWASNKTTDRFYPAQATMSAEEADVYNNAITDIMTYGSEMITKFITGQEPLSGFDAYVAKMKDMKVDECIKYKQAAYERYQARK